MSNEKVADIVPEGEVPDCGNADVDAAPYSVFSIWQKRWIVLLTAVAGIFSPMSSFIFYPAINSIAEGLNTTVGLVDLAVTTYMIVSGITPAILGNAADKLGRRPIYIFALSVYLVANIGLALQNSYAALLVLRMVQSAGSSGTISLGYGVIADIAEPAERGFYVGVSLLGPNVAPPLGPVLGGIIAARLGWKWIFWFLAIIGGTVLLVIFMVLPETARSIVGNGDIYHTGIYRPLIRFLSREQHPHERTGQNQQESKFSLPNPLACLKLLLIKEVFIVLLCNGIYYATYCCIQASLSTLFIDIYGYRELQAGLIYIPFGLGCLLSTYIWGRVLNRDYAKVAKSSGMEDVHQRSQNFPIELARLGSSYYLIGLAAVSMIGYGWTIERRVHVSVPLLLQTIVGFTQTALFVAFGTLLTDLNPNRSSTAAASANIVRCALAAGGLALLQPLIDALGPGWYFTILGLLNALSGPLVLAEIKVGPKWRASRLAQSEA
ncbi:major facilitator superfamily transporter [Xylariomycetidae sp. FL2044]|nr:major facilitator superfamily transporter [Xylariomycetidae sp. FL2044]